MPLPPPTAVGERLKSQWINDLRGEVASDKIISSEGINAFRSESGTLISLDREFDHQSPNGIKVSVINETGEDLLPYWFAGIEKVAGRDTMVGGFSDVNYALRKPTEDDFAGRLVMLFEPIKKKSVGIAYIRSEGIMTRVKYATDGSQDDLRFATIDTTAKASSENAFLLKASSGGPVIVLDVEKENKEHKGWRWAVVRFPIGGGGVLENPHDLTYTGEHSEEASTNFYTNAESEEVMIDLREPPTGTQGFKITQSLGGAYYDASDETLYGYVADYHYDSSGRLVFIERERRVIVDTPEDCA